MKRILGITLLLLAASPRLFAQCSDAEAKRLAEFDSAWGEALKRGDRAFLQNVYADDFRDITLGGMKDKARSIEDSIRIVQEAAKHSWDQYVIACTPNTATITHRGTWTASVNGREQTSYTRSVHLLEKRGGRWQVVSNTNHPLDDAGILLYMERDWNDALKNRDAGWFERNYAHDASDVSSTSGVLHSKAEAINEARTDKTVFESLELSDLNARVDGNKAIVNGINHVKGKDAQGKPFDRRVLFTDVFIKRDGRWLVWATQGTEMRQ